MDGGLWIPPARYNDMQGEEEEEEGKKKEKKSTWVPCILFIFDSVQCFFL